MQSRWQLPTPTVYAKGAPAHWREKPMQYIPLAQSGSALHDAPTGPPSLGPVNFAPHPRPRPSAKIIETVEIAKTSGMFRDIIS